MFGAISNAAIAQGAGPDDPTRSSTRRCGCSSAVAVTALLTLLAAAFMPKDKVEDHSGEPAS